MTDHDPLCRCQHMEVEIDPDDVGGCDCALIDRVRADERQQVGRVWAKREDLRDAHAEAVAARLVEVIVSQDIQIRLLRRSNRTLMAEEDALRQRLDRTLIDYGRELAWVESGRRTALADLRAISDRWESDPDRYDIEINAVRDALALIEEAQHD